MCIYIFTIKIETRKRQYKMVTSWFMVITLLSSTMIIFLSSAIVQANTLRVEPNNKPSSSSSSDANKKPNPNEYDIPQFPLPPRPAGSPPPTMPFAVIETEHMNAFTPPSETRTRFKIPGSYNGDKKKDVNDDKGSNDGDGAGAAKGLNLNARMGDIPYDEPPTTRNMIPPTKLPPGSTSDGANELRKDSVNPYCNFCIAYMATINQGNGDACSKFPARSQTTCKRVVATLKLQNEPLRLKKGCIDRTGIMAKVRGPGQCPPIVACNLMRAGNGMPMCGIVINSWGAWKDSNSDHLSTINPNPLPNAMPPSKVSGASNPYCEICSIFMNYGAGTQKSNEEICSLMSESQTTDCLAVVKELKRNVDVSNILKEGCIDTTSGKGNKVNPCPGTVACNLIRDTTKGPMCGGMLEEFGKRIDEGVLMKEHSNPNFVPNAQKPELSTTRI